MKHFKTLTRYTWLFLLLVTLFSLLTNLPIYAGAQINFPFKKASPKPHYPSLLWILFTDALNPMLPNIHTIISHNACPVFSTGLWLYTGTSLLSLILLVAIYVVCHIGAGWTYMCPKALKSRAVLNVLLIHCQPQTQRCSEHFLSLSHPDC